MSPFSLLSCILTFLILSGSGATAAQVNFVGSQKLDADEGGITPGLIEDGDRFGRSVSRLGDLDLDGVVDIAVGARSDDDGGTDAGAVYILFLHSDGTVKNEQKISTTQGGLAPGLLDPGDWFGYSLALMSDLNADGVQDLAVGAPNDDDMGQNSGAVYILFLNRDGTVKGHQKISNTQGDLGAVLAPGDCFAQGAGSLGDLNGDGLIDLGVGAPLTDDGANNAGAAHLLFMAPGGMVASSQRISATSGGFGPGLDVNDNLGGRIVVAIGDIDGDGRDELAAGAFRDNDGGTDRGAIYILFLNSQFTVSAKQKISFTTGGFGGDLEDEDLFGMTIAPIGDVDGDGVPDIAVGNNKDDDGATDEGSLFLLTLNPDGTVKNEQKISPTLNTVPGLYFEPGERFGRAMGWVGSLVPGGPEVLAVGAGAGVGGGAVWLLFKEAPDPWVNLGAPLPGAHGPSSLSGDGTLHPGDPVALTLTGALESAQTTLVIGLSTLALPFKGGTLWPAPDALLPGFFTTSAGELALAGNWPGGIPSGLTFTFQMWMVDATGPAGMAASNGLTGTTP